MSKEIKFRAWDKMDKVMCDVTYMKFSKVQYTNVGYRKNIRGKLIDENAALDENMSGTCVLMRYTGEHDKNGKELYEGDIVSFEAIGEEGYEYREGIDFMNRAVIVWNDGRFELDRFLSDNSGVLDDMNDCHKDFWNVLKGCEVVGNIYDNPALLHPQN
ncbi:MAG: YopX family protein [Clostridiales bacterium]|nr:YopX family protein [Clostridiales bacterium]